MRINYITFGSLYRDNAGQLSSDTASARYRVLAPARQLRRIGHHIRILSPTEKFWRQQHYRELGGDVTVFSKSFDPRNEELALFLRQAGQRIVLDICDDHFDHPQLGPHFRRMAELADRLVASTAAMAGIVRSTTGRSSIVIGDPVEGLRREPLFQPADGAVRAVWFGHTVNLDSLFAALPDLLIATDLYRLELQVVTSAIPGLDQRLQAWNRDHESGPVLKLAPWSLATVTQCLHDCDLVLIPSLDSTDKHVKSANRIIETLWAGRLAVAYPVPSYREFGDFAHLRENLGEGLLDVLQNPDRYQERIAAGQSYIERHYLPEHIALQWQQVLCHAAAPRDGSTSVPQHMEHA